MIPQKEQAVFDAIEDALRKPASWSTPEPGARRRQSRRRDTQDPPPKTRPEDNRQERPTAMTEADLPEGVAFLQSGLSGPLPGAIADLTSLSATSLLPGDHLLGRRLAEVVLDEPASGFGDHAHELVDLGFGRLLEIPIVGCLRDRFENGIQRRPVRRTIGLPGVWERLRYRGRRSGGNPDRTACIRAPGG